MIEFTILEGDKEVKLKVRNPTGLDQKEAEKQRRIAFTEACNQACSILRINLNNILKSKGLWNDQLDAEYNQLVSEIQLNEIKLLKGGIKKSEAKKIALENLKKRKELIKFDTERLKLDNMTIEAQSDDAKFDRLVSLCTVYLDNDKPYFKSFDDYINKKNTLVGYLAASNLAKLIYNYEDNPEKNTTEYKFLKKMGYVNDDMRLINENGHLVDEDGRLINEDGFYVNEQGERVDIFGNKVDIFDEDSLDKAVFLEEDGTPIINKTEEVVAEPEKAAE